MRTYLSVDLDWWAAGTEGSLVYFFAHVFDLKLPICVAPFHDQLLDHINANPCERLINVDYHSDLVDIPTPAEDLSLTCLNEGTWGNFVAWKQSAAFVWRYPKCIHEPANGFCHCDYDPFKNACHCGWRATKMATGLGCIPWRTVHAIGVCLSSYWLNGAPVQRITDRLGISGWRTVSLKLQREQRPFLWTAVSIAYWKAVRQSSSARAARR